MFFLLLYICLLPKAACLMITILLYCAFMSTFSWMLVEAIHLFRMIVVVYGIERDLKVLYGCIGWGNNANLLINIVINVEIESFHINSQHNTILYDTINYNAIQWNAFKKQYNSFVVCCLFVVAFWGQSLPLTLIHLFVLYLLYNNPTGIPLLMTAIVSAIGQENLHNRTLPR